MTTRVLPPDADGLRQAASALRAGRPVVMPTETVYGLAADATSPAAVDAVFQAKERPADDPLIVHVSPGLLGPDPLAGLVARGLVAPLAGARSTVVAALLAHGWPGPLTLVLPRGPAVPPAVSSGLPTVAVRMPAHPVALALLDAAALPLVAPSANRFGRISPTTAEAARAELEGRVDLILDGGPCAVGVESTVLRVEEDGTLGLLRPGVVTADDVRAWTGRRPEPAGHADGSAGSPGRLLSHYAPHAPLVLVSDDPARWSTARWSALAARLPRGRLGYLAWRDPGGASLVAARLGAQATTRVLAPDGEVGTAARALYRALRELDAAAPDLLIAELPPEREGLAGALHDRLTRAAHGTPPLP